MQRYICLLLFLVPVCGHSAEGSEPTESRFTFLPGGILVQPFTANYQEPRVGVRKDFSSSHMKLDIGSTLDLLEYTISPDNSARLRAGIDFFTYALSTSAEAHRLQIDAVDGFFGGHISYAVTEADDRYMLRLRILHLSAHFLDGHYDHSTGAWKNGLAPIPFTKDFGEIIGAYEFQWSGVTLMVYTGFSYATLIRPRDVHRFSMIHGIEAHLSSGSAFGKPLNLFVADNLSFVGVPSYIGTNNLEAGVKLGEWTGSGVRFYVNYYSGLRAYSQYYNVQEQSWGAGFTFDVW